MEIKEQVNEDYKPTINVVIPEGCELVAREPNILQVDLDGVNSLPSSLIDQVRILDENYSVESIEYWKSKDGGLHVQVKTVTKFNDQEALVAQSFLGSDLLREFLGIARRRSGLKPVSFLFRPVDVQIFNATDRMWWRELK